MTTIACDGYVMAGDGQREHRGSITNRNSQKVRRLKDGSLIGTAGCVAFGERVEAWLNGEGEAPKDCGDGGFACLWLKVDGTLFLIGEECQPSMIEAPFAVGSGMDIAIGAMRCGVNPKRAVEIAAEVDPGTGGAITVLPLAAFAPPQQNPGEKG